ncbi:MAG: class IV adenylate cyclase [Planctomycetaceae bacterium]|jgi:adenylate cyclase class 2|nr:class IV adenylate cyclase [Planctomycetaceae bacterium]
MEMENARAVYEVEMKFRVADVKTFEDRLRMFGGILGQTVEEVDRFYQHPQRDFSITDECLRVRRRKLPDGTEEKFLTYKGPKMDQETKTRREIEIRLDSREPWELMLELLGFREKDMVRKFRRRCELLILNQSVEVVLDFLPELEKSDDGGTFAELETIASESDWKVKRELIMNLAKDFGFSESIRTSYLELLNKNRNVVVPPS